jgi:hypothetical protein
MQNYQYDFWITRARHALRVSRRSFTSTNQIVSGWCSQGAPGRSVPVYLQPFGVRMGKLFSRGIEKDRVAQ